MTIEPSLILFNPQYRSIYLHWQNGYLDIPRIDERDNKAFNELNLIGLWLTPQKYAVADGSEINYSLNTGLHNRKFLDWIGFPLVLDVSNYTSKHQEFIRGK
jgi:hypothetical protein